MPLRVGGDRLMPDRIVRDRDGAPIGVIVWNGADKTSLVAPNVLDRIARYVDESPERLRPRTRASYKRPTD